MAELLFLNGLLLSRLIYIFNDEHLSRNAQRILGIAQAGLCLLIFTAGWPSLLLALLTILALLASERWLSEDWLNESRFTSLMIIMITSAFLGDKLSLAPWSETICSRLSGLFPGTVANSDDLLQPVLWFTLGFLLVANEANLLIRSLFHRFDLAPKVDAKNNDKSQTDKPDEQEYNAGRIIGILERWLIYSVLMVSQNYNVIALIMAAKGFARFRQMEERAFAEYVLIGTLSSMLITILIARIIHSLSGSLPT